MARFRKFVRAASNGCWEWTGKKRLGRYGIFYFDGRDHTAHRLLFSYLVFPDIDGLEVHHICENPGCVNPSHLTCLNKKHHVSVTVFPRSTHRRLQTHCKRGHLFDEANTYFGKGGNGKYNCRFCRTCMAMHARKHRAKERMA